MSGNIEQGRALFRVLAERSAAASKRHDWPESERLLREITALAPTYAPGYIYLAGALLEQGRQEEALDEARKAEALEREPISDFALGVLFGRLHRREESQRYLGLYLAREANDPLGARLMLARFGIAPLPDRAGDAQMQLIYADRASWWDEGSQGYRAAQLVADALLAASPGPEKLDILDAGCGTGLVGALIRSKASRLTGVDISAPMLERARAKNIYDELRCEDMISFMAAQERSFDAITSAATLIHFGDLRPVLCAARHTLRSGGVFLFTLLPSESDEAYGVADNVEWAQGGCFSHGQAYIRHVAAEAGFAVPILESHTHETVNGVSIGGMIVWLTRQDSRDSDARRRPLA